MEGTGGHVAACLTLHLIVTLYIYIQGVRNGNKSLRERSNHQCASEKESAFQKTFVGMARHRADPAQRYSARWRHFPPQSISQRRGDHTRERTLLCLAPAC